MEYKRDRVEFAEIMYGLADNFRDAVTKPGLRFRFDALKQYSVEQVRQAAMHIVKTRKFTKMPTVGEIILVIEGDPDANREDRAELEATKVLDAIQNVGSYQSPKFEDPITSDIVSKRFGWGHLCQSVTVDRRQWFIREFKDAYLSHTRQAEKQETTPMIEAGQTEKRDVKGLIANIGNGGNIEILGKTG